MVMINVAMIKHKGRKGTIDEVLVSKDSRFSNDLGFSNAPKKST
jgi:hypothetical protein